MRSRLRRRVIGLAALAFGLGLFWAGRSFAAAACPRCFGLEQVSPGVYLDGAMSSEDRARSVQAITEGSARVASFFEGRQSRPRILACASERCFHRIGGGRDRGRTLLAMAVLLSPRGLNPTIAAHELSHAEVHARIGALRQLGGAIPAWFDEGLAVVVSDDPRYLAPEGSQPDRCTVEPGQSLPRSDADWRHAAGEVKTLYAQAGCRVERWSTAHGGGTAVIRLLDRVAQGEPFEAALGR